MIGSRDMVKIIDDILQARIKLTLIEVGLLPVPETGYEEALNRAYHNTVEKALDVLLEKAAK